MDWQDGADISCPYCGETLTLGLDYSAARQTYVEDCHVCCRPMLVTVRVHSPEDIEVDVRPEND